MKAVKTTEKWVEPALSTSVLKTSNPRNSRKSRFVKAMEYAAREEFLPPHLRALLKETRRKKTKPPVH